MALLDSIATSFRDWVNLKARAIRVRSNNFKPCIIRIKGSANSESDEGGIISSEIIFVSWFEFPVLYFLEFLIPMGVEMLRKPLYCVIRTDGVIDEGDETLSELFAPHQQILHSSKRL